jgi:alkylation response protein AidB-like acyl-CoA dehydrogenase
MTPDQHSLVDLADQVLRGRTSPEQLAAVEQSASRVDARLWSELSAAGLAGIAVPEEHGGAGLGLTELCLLLEQHGRRLGLVPLWENGVAALVLARSTAEEARKRWLAGAADGTTPLTVAADLTGAADAVTAADGRLSGALLVPSGTTAAAAVVVTAVDVWLVELAGLDRFPVTTTTHGLAADVVLRDTPAERLDVDPTWARDAARLALSAAQLGNADEGIREAASYVSAREQFGRPLATFQAVSQQLADCYCDVQAMRATLWQAVWALEQGGGAERVAARREVDVATWWAADAGVRVAIVVQHLHGGIGADTTYPVHRRLLRALETDALLGGATRQLARLGPALVGT